MHNPFKLCWLPVALALLGCQETEKHRFEFIPPARSGIDFENTIPQNDTINIVLYEYLFNGGGVGVGDFDRDGRPDLFFSASFAGQRLYLQQESWKFTDVTEAAGLGYNDWTAGVNIADINGDGWDDLYVATLDPKGTDVDGPAAPPNLLYLNQGIDESGIPTFREVAAEAGLADRGYGTHSTWIDYDHDGDLDLYVLNNAIEDFNRNLPKGIDSSGRARSRDQLYLNVGGNAGLPKFELLPNGIKQEGWGLGLVAQDFNRDHHTDLYVANDYISEDFYLEGLPGGGWRQAGQRAFRHTSKNSMGVDAADLDNDGWPEVMTLDMLPDDNLRQKTMFAEVPHQADRTARLRGYQRQYVRNALQLNNGDGTFSDIAFMAGVAATDWSWAPLLADFDNDGWRDIFISNGYPRDITDRDFVDFSERTNQFGTQEARVRRILEALDQVPGVHQPDFLFRNRGDLTFEPTDWLPDRPTYANGAVFVDLDRDGDLDLVTNNLNEPAGLYRNNSRALKPDSTHYLQVELVGPPDNSGGLGAQLYLVAGNLRLYHEQQRQRGYLSTVDALVHFGLGHQQVVDTLSVRWPDGHTNLLTAFSADTLLKLEWKPGTEPPPPLAGAHPLASTPLAGPVHHESAYRDFDRYALALRDHSRAGPAMTTIDLTGDGSELLVFGGAAGQVVSLWERGQMTNGAESQSWVAVAELEETKESEASTLLVFDFDDDGDQDLYVGNGSSEFLGGDYRHQDLLYRNEGGRLVLTEGVLPTSPDITTAVAAADLEGDGDLDLFLGSRQLPGEYPRPGRSLLLRNEGGRFTVTQAFAPGMVTDAVFADLSGDGLPELALVGEYLGLLLYDNKDGELRIRSDNHQAALTGWWYCLTAGDLDGDGDLDLLGGNAGTNNPYAPKSGRPLVLLADDYDGNEALDPVATVYDDGARRPVHPRNTLTRQLPAWKKLIPDFATYGRWTVDDLPVMGKEGIRLEAGEFRSVYFENDGAGGFAAHPLPNSAQTAPLRDAITNQLPDGRTAFLCVQNDYATEVLGGWMDAGTGFALALDTAGEVEVLTDFWSVSNDARSLVKWKDRIIIGVNGEKVAIRPAVPPDDPT